jgi:hypothetical protein
MENRLPILQAYEAFKAFIPTNANDIPLAWLRYLPSEEDIPEYIEGGRPIRECTQINRQC